MNDMYAKDISKKIKSVKRDKQRKGLFIGGKPLFGYKKHPSEKNKIVIDENAAPIVRRIFNMALEGMSCHQIAQRLNEEKVPTPAAYAGLKTGRSGPYAGLWSGERISDMLQNEIYIGNMVQGRSVKISYKSKKSVRQARENWVVVEGTHEPIIDKDTFYKVQSLLNSRRRTRLRTYDFPLKGLIYCHECGYPLGVINRKTANGEDCLYFVCRTYQRFTKSRVCTCHSIKEKTVTEAVLGKVREICEGFLDPGELCKTAERAILEARKDARHEGGARELREKIENLSAQLDKIYLDKLSGVLDERDFERIYPRVKAERAELERRLLELESAAANEIPPDNRAMELAQGFIEGAFASREVLVSLIERVELTEDKEVIIRFRFSRPEGLEILGK